MLFRSILGTVMVLLGFLSWGFTYALAAADGDGGPTPWKALNSIAVKSECLRTDTGNIIDIIFSQGGIKQPIQVPP